MDLTPARLPSSPEPDVEDVQRRVRGYWAIDGAAELAAGITFLAVAALFALEARLLAGGRPVPSLSAIGLPVVILLGYGLTAWIVRAIKARITYPRAGYVSFTKPEPRQRFVTLVFAAVLGLGIGFLFAVGPDLDRWVTALQGSSIAFFLLWIGDRLGIGRLRLLAVGVVAIGLLVAWVNLGPVAGTAWTMGGIGALLLGSGGLTLGRFMQTYPLPSEEC